MNTYTLKGHGSLLSVMPLKSSSILIQPRKSVSPSEMSPSPNRDQIRDVIQDLIEITNDGVAGYTHAATHVHDRGLRDEFHKFARERKSMVSELNSLLEELGCSTEPRQVEPGADTHRAWINIHIVATQGNDQALLDEAERGEDIAESTYSASLENPALPAKVRAVLSSLLEKVTRAHVRMQSLQESGIYGIKSYE